MKGKISKAVEDWVIKNRKLFWRFEVSYRHKTYRISILNLPEPSPGDIVVQDEKRLLNEDQKKKLSDSIKKVIKKSGSLTDTSVDIQIDYVDGTVVARPL